MTKSEHYI